MMSGGSSGLDRKPADTANLRALDEYDGAATLCPTPSVFLQSRNKTRKESKDEKIRKLGTERWKRGSSEGVGRKSELVMEDRRRYEQRRDRGVKGT